MEIKEFVEQVENCNSFLPLAGFNVREWITIKKYVTSGEIIDQEIFESAKEKIENFERNIYRKAFGHA